MDGGFFEKFGSLLRQKSEIAEEHVIAPLAPLHEDDVSVTDHLNTIEEGEHDSGTETLPDSDSEHEEPDVAKKEELIEDFTGWNVSRAIDSLIYCFMWNHMPDQTKENKKVFIATG